MWNITSLAKFKRKVSLIDLADLIEVIVLELYSDHFIVHHFPTLDCIRVYGSNCEFAEFSKEEILKNKTAKSFVNLVKCKLRLGGFISKEK